jgi:glycosyltransferase involved in cell wall biosynthesis
LNHEFPPLEGGGANASYFISRALVRMGWEVDVVTSDLGQFPQEEMVDGIALHRVAGRRRPLGPARLFDLGQFVISGWREALRLASARRPDATIAFFGVPGGLVGLAPRARHGVPLIISLRGTDVPGNNPETFRVSHKFLGPLTRAVWRRAERVTAVSEELRDMALRSAPNLRIEVIPNGVDTERFRPAVAKRSKGPVRVLSVGQTIARKGHATLIQVLPEMIRRSGTDVRVLIVGREGPEHRALVDLARREGVADRVELRGPVPKESMPGIYREADVLTHLSVCEGMSNVVLEAMACGLPVVATRVGGMSALVEPGVNGALVPVGDVEATTESLVPLLSGPAPRERYSKGSRARAENFSWERCAERYADLVAEVAASQPPT